MADPVVLVLPTELLSPDAGPYCGHMWGTCYEMDGDNHMCRALKPCPGHECFFCGASG